MWFAFRIPLIGIIIANGGFNRAFFESCNGKISKGLWSIIDFYNFYDHIRYSSFHLLLVLITKTGELPNFGKRYF